VLVSSALTFSALDRRGLTQDEAGSIAYAHLGLRELWTKMATDEANMGLYYVLLHVWVRVGDSEIASRSLSAALGVGAVPVMYVLGRALFGPAAGLTAALLLGTNAFFVSWSRQARAYSLLVLLVTVAALCLVKAIQTRDGRYWAAYVVSGAAAVYAHFFGALVLPAHAASLACAPRGAVRPRTGLLAAASLAVLLSPLVVFLATAARIGHLAWVARARPLRVHELLVTFAGGQKLLIVYGVVCLPVFLGQAVQAYRTGKGQGAWPHALVVGWLALPIAAILVASTVQPMFVDRFLIVCLPPLLLIAGTGLAGIRPAGLRVVILAIVLLGAGGALHRMYVAPDLEGWREAARIVHFGRRPGDAVITGRGAVRPVAYYLRKLGSPLEPVTLSEVERLRQAPATEPPRPAPARVWFVARKRVTGPLSAEGDLRVEQVLSRAYPRSRRFDLELTRLELYEGAPPGSGSP
jgi:mannosyltransferase